jgi:hypothetical protein
MSSTSTSATVDTSGFLTKVEDDPAPKFSAEVDFDNKGAKNLGTLTGGFDNNNDGITQVGDIEDAGNIQLNGQIYEDAMEVHSPAGSPLNIDWNDGNIQKIDLENMGGDLTLTFSNEQPTTMTLYVKQATGGGINILWPANATFDGGTAPTITTTADALDVIGFGYDDEADEFHGSFGQDKQ